MTTVYIVSDVGVSSPCYGVIVAAFNTYQEAKDLADKVNAAGEEYGFDDDDLDVGEQHVRVHSMVIGQVNKIST